MTQDVNAMRTLSRIPIILQGSPVGIFESTIEPRVRTRFLNLDRSQFAVICSTDIYKQNQVRASINEAIKRIKETL